MPLLRTVHRPAVQGGPRRCAMAVRSKGMPKGAVPAPLGWHGGSVERKCVDDQRRRRAPLFAQLYFKINSGLRTRTAFRGCRSVFSEPRWKGRRGYRSKFAKSKLFLIG
uniref:Uncharacterized protein n=1 Tax=Trichuris muris TaxID=70415 RepID=A0A5S6Q9B3_TRIMR